MRRPVKIVAMLTLAFTLDEAQLVETFCYWMRSIQPLLGPGYTLGVAGSGFAAATPTLEAFREAMQDTVAGLSYKDYAQFAADRAARIFYAVRDPDVAAVWIYNGGALGSRERSDTIRCMAEIVRSMRTQQAEFQALRVGTAQSPPGEESAGERPPLRIEPTPQKPLLGYCYGTAIMAILGIWDVCRPIHCPLGKDVAQYASYPEDIAESQLTQLTQAVRGELKVVKFPPGLELHNQPAARFASEHHGIQGFVVVGLVQILHGILSRYLPPRTPVILVPEFLDFGDELDLLLDLADMHVKGSIKLEIVLFGHHCVKDVARFAELHQVRETMMSMCPTVPFLAGLPVGHEQPNHLVPMGWATIRCEPSTGETCFTYARDDFREGSSHPTYLMVPPGAPDAFAKMLLREEPKEAVEDQAVEAEPAAPAAAAAMLTPAPKADRSGELDAETLPIPSARATSPPPRSQPPPPHRPHDRTAYAPPPPPAPQPQDAPASGCHTPFMPEAMGWTRVGGTPDSSVPQYSVQTYTPASYPASLAVSPTPPPPPLVDYPPECPVPQFSVPAFQPSQYLPGTPPQMPSFPMPMPNMTASYSPQTFPSPLAYPTYPTYPNSSPQHGFPSPYDSQTLRNLYAYVAPSSCPPTPPAAPQNYPQSPRYPQTYMVHPVQPPAYPQTPPPQPPPQPPLQTPQYPMTYAMTPATYPSGMASPAPNAQYPNTYAIPTAQAPAQYPNTYVLSTPQEFRAPSMQSPGPQYQYAQTYASAYTPPAPRQFQPLYGPSEPESSAKPGLLRRLSSPAAFLKGKGAKDPTPPATATQTQSWGYAVNQSQMRRLSAPAASAYLSAPTAYPPQADYSRPFTPSYAGYPRPPTPGAAAPYRPSTPWGAGMAQRPPSGGGSNPWSTPAQSGACYPSGRLDADPPYLNGPKKSHS